MLERRSSGITAGFFLALFFGVTLIYHANTQLFTDPFASKSLAASAGILFGSLAILPGPTLKDLSVAPLHPTEAWFGKHSKLRVPENC